jgi:hypothetical protein
MDAGAGHAAFALEISVEGGLVFTEGFLAEFFAAFHEGLLLPLGEDPVGGFVLEGETRPARRPLSARAPVCPAMIPLIQEAGVALMDWLPAEPHVVSESASSFERHD